MTRPGAAEEQVVEGAVGDEPASVVVTALFETGQPFLTLINEHGTPTSSAQAGADE